mgnify:CR=1 FL=1
MNKIIVLGSSGLLGKEVLNYLNTKKYNVCGVDIKPDYNCKNNLKFDITKLKSKEEFNIFLENIIDSETKYIIIIDCLLIKNNIKNETIEEFHNSFLCYLTTSICLAKWFGEFCTKREIKGSMVMMSSIKAFSAPKFYHYENTNMNSELEYGVSKAGISLAVKDLSVRYKGLVRYNAIAPGGIEGEKHIKTFLDKYNQSCLIKPGLIKPLEIAKLVDFIIREDCPIIGQTITIDNGWSLT